MSQKSNVDYLEPIFAKDIDIGIRPFLKNVDAHIIKTVESELFAVYQSGFSKFSASDTASMLSEIPCKNHLHLCYRNILIEAILKSDMSAPGAGIYCAIFATKFLLEFMKLAPHKAKAVLDIREECTKLARFSSIVGFQEAISASFDYINNEAAKEIAEYCMNHAGLDGKISVTHGESLTKVILSSGYDFKISPPPAFILSSGSQDWTLFNFVPILIDGIIETVGEIHHILEKCSNEKIPAVIFCRGMSEEVIATLAANYKRKTLNIIPVVVPVDMASINMLKDIAVITGNDITSSLKGELISKIAIEEINTAKKAIIKNGAVKIIDEKNALSVLVHTRALARQRNEEYIPEKITLLNNRIKNLSAICAEVFLGPDLGFSREEVGRQIGASIKVFNSVCHFGLISVDDIIKNTEESQLYKIVRNIGFFLKRCDIKQVPAESFIVGLQTGFKTAKLLSGTSVFLTSDRAPENGRN